MPVYVATTRNTPAKSIGEAGERESVSAKVRGCGGGLRTRHRDLPIATTLHEWNESECSVDGSASRIRPEAPRVPHRATGEDPSATSRVARTVRRHSAVTSTIEIHPKLSPWGDAAAVATHAGTNREFKHRAMP